MYGLPAALGVVGGLQGLAKGSISGSLGLLRVGGTSDMGSGGSLRGGRFAQGALNSTVLCANSNLILTQLVSSSVALPCYILKFAIYNLGIASKWQVGVLGWLGVGWYDWG